MKLGRIVTTLAIGGAALALIGTGVASSFTDSATASENISVGTLGLQITSPTAGAVVTNTGTLPGATVHTVTYTAPTIELSAPGSAPLDFTITNTGTMAFTFSISSSDNMKDGFLDILGSPGPFTLAPGVSQSFNAGLQWYGELTNASLGNTYSITYTITATA